jgi:hypothetical protein
MTIEKNLRAARKSHKGRLYPARIVLQYTAAVAGELEPQDRYPPRSGSAACHQRRGTSRPVRRT